MADEEEIREVQEKYQKHHQLMIRTESQLGQKERSLKIGELTLAELEPLEEASCRTFKQVGKM